MRFDITFVAVSSIDDPNFDGRRVPPLSNLVEGDPPRPPVHPAVLSIVYPEATKRTKPRSVTESFNDPRVSVPNENL